MIGEISIIGEIGSYEDDQGNLIKGVDLIDVVASIEAQKAISKANNDPITLFKVTINSPGGFVDVGFDIYYYLRTITEPVKTLAVNMCASIATIIWFAGSSRVNTCPLMIHNPWLTNVSGDADQLQQAADQTRATENRLISFYAKNTGMEKTAIDALMRKETYISPEMAFNLKFSTELPTENITKTVNYKAVAKQKEFMSTETKTIGAKLDELLKVVNKIISPKPKALMTTESSGKTLQIMNGDGSEITDGGPDAGDVVTIDGAPCPDGDYILPDYGITITTVGGTIQTVVDTAAGSQDKKLEAANKKIQELEATIAASKAESEESKKDMETVNKKLVEFEGLLKNMKGKTELPATKTTIRKPGEPDTRSLKERTTEAKKIIAERNAKK